MRGYFKASHYRSNKEQCSENSEGTWIKCHYTNENFPGHRFETQIHFQTQIRLNTILTLATKHLLIINKNTYIYLHLKIFQRNLISNCCVTSFFCRCLVKLDEYPCNPNFLNNTKLKLKSVDYPGSQISQITPN